MKILITAGPTREAIDPVRFLSNRSSGKMGYAIAEAAIAAGHEALLISGPVSLAAPDRVNRIPVESAQHMFDAVAAHIGFVDVAIMAAAVADYQPVAVAREKIKKHCDEMTLQLKRTRDILGSARSKFEFQGFLVGFAAETSQLENNATDKLQRKSCDMIVANDVSDQGIGFDSDENAAIVFYKDGRTHQLPRTTKSDLAKSLIQLIETAILTA